jgi:hypothetical protein
MIKIGKKQLTGNTEATLINALNCYKDTIEDNIKGLSSFNIKHDNSRIELKRVNRLLKAIGEVIK